MAGHIHGNPEQAEKDNAIRAKLDSLDYEVVVVRSFELDDKNAVVRAISRVAKYLVGKAKQREVKKDTGWFERADEGAIDPQAPNVEQTPVFSVIEGGRDSGSPSSPTLERPPLRIVEPAPEELLTIPMNRRIPNGAWCLWRAQPGGTHQGNVVIAQHREIHDPEHGGTLHGEGVLQREAPKRRGCLAT